MKYIHEPNLFDKWQEISSCLTIIANSNTGIDYIKSALSYSLTKVEQTDKIELENMLKSCLNPKVEEEIMGSIAHHWLQEGIEKGIEKGMQKGIEKGMQEGIEKGMQKGIEKGMQIGEMKLVELTKKMLRKNKPLDEIVEFTGFTTKEIKKLQKQLQK